MFLLELTFRLVSNKLFILLWLWFAIIFWVFADLLWFPMLFHFCFLFSQNVSSRNYNSSLVPSFYCKHIEVWHWRNNGRSDECCKLTKFFKKWFVGILFNFQSICIYKIYIFVLRQRAGNPDYYNSWTPVLTIFIWNILKP